ncbi:hypothetical protein NDU88_006222 [Pleurodeles waltl]|uniref:Uncharacterized protein n=1 Tax=Pleurodeles waltl TaxID=8319 RepID=A0AAV7MYX4_PLEWA|nr:hypothetical protein NDU88_006222 [Pleurodeles waltl]
MRRCLLLGTVDSTGTQLAHQLPGTPSGFVRNPVFDSGLGFLCRPSEDGQSVCSAVHKWPKGHVFEGPRGIGKRFLAFLPPTPGFGDGRESSGLPECSSRLELQVSEGFQRVAAGPSNFSGTHGALGSMLGGPLCVQMECPVTDILQLASTAVDAFLQDPLGVCFPPFLLIPTVSAQVRHQGATVVLITPLWRSQVSFPSLLALSCDFPIHLLSAPSILRDRIGRPHPLALQGHLALVALKISGLVGRTADFHRKLRDSSDRSEPRELANVTSPRGIDGLVDVWENKSIRWGPRLRIS